MSITVKQREFVLVPDLATRENFALRRAAHLQSIVPGLPHRFALAAAWSSMALEWERTPYWAAQAWQRGEYRDLANNWALSRCQSFAKKQAVGGGAS